MYKLIVRHAFGPYAKGQMILDQDEVARLSEKQHKHVIRVAMTPDEQAQAEQISAAKAAATVH